MKTRRRKWTMLLFLSVLTIPVSAQTISGGIMGGVSTGPVKIVNIEEGFTDAMEGKGIYGYEGGIFLKLQFYPIYIKPGLLYTAKEGELKYLQKPAGELPGINRTVNFTVERFEAPVLLGLNILGPFLSIEAGPVYNYLVNSTENFNGNKLELAKNGFGYRAGVSSELGPLLLNVSYQGFASITSAEKATYKEPYKIIFGLGLILAETR